MKEKIILLDCPKEIVKHVETRFKNFFEIKIITIICNSAVVHDSIQSKNKFAFWELPSIINEKEPGIYLSSEDLLFLQCYETIYRELETRWHGFSNKVVEQDSNYRFFKQVNYWKIELEKERINGTFAFYPPHTIASYPVYVASKLLGIPFLFLDVPRVLKRYLFLSHRIGSRTALIFNTNLKQRNLTKDLIDFRRYVASPEYEPPIPQSLANNRLLTIKSAILQLWSLVPGLKSKVTIPSFLQFSSKGFFFMDGQSRSQRYAAFFHLRKLKIKRLRRFYKKICAPVESIEKPFVYYALHLHPEATTLPLACEARNWMIFADYLLAGIPEDHLLVVKLNPVQISKFLFTPSHYSDGISIESLDYFRRKSRLVFVSEETETLEMIRKSQATATINGTLAIESISLSKPCFVFGENWYTGLPGVVEVESPEDIKKWFSSVQKFETLGNIDFSISEDYLIEPSVLDRKKFCSCDIDMLVNSFRVFLDTEKNIGVNIDKY